MVKNDYKYILISVKAETSTCDDWRTGFLEEDTFNDETPTNGPGSDFVAFKDAALTADSGSKGLDCV
jgi:hypothetical protein